MAVNNSEIVKEILKAIPEGKISDVNFEGSKYSSLH
jgi:hypothetical protein